MRLFFAGAILLFLSTMCPQRCCAGQATRLACDIWPPYQMYQNNELTGYSVGIVKAVYERMGIPLEQPIPTLPWSRCLSMLEDGSADAIFSANYAPARERYAAYPDEPLISTPWVIWSRSGHRFTSMEDLRNLRIGVVRQYSYTPEFWKFIQANCRVEKVSNDETNFKKLSAGHLNATVAELANGLYLLKKLDIKNIVPITHLKIRETGLYIIFSKKSVPHAFVEEFSRELSAFKATPQFRLLHDKYIDLNETKTPFSSQ